MDLNDYWQENKRSLVATASGAIVFLVGSMLVNSFFRDELNQQRRIAESAAQKMRTQPMFSESDLSAAQKENEELRRSVEALSKSVAFRPRAGFRVDPARATASSQYFTAVSRVREELLTLAGRGNLRVQEDLGLPALSPTREGEIVRYLEALDLVDRAVHLAIAAGVERIDKIEIKLDPKLASRQGVGEIERTRIEITASGKAGPLVQLLSLSQSPLAVASALGGGASAFGGGASGSAVGASGSAGAGAEPLLIEKAEVLPARTGSEANLDVTFVVARLPSS